MNRNQLEIWSATPTPFEANLSIDRSSVRRLVAHHLRLGVTGLMLGGTCGEGPWMTLDDLVELTNVTKAESGDRLCIAVQVSDNSVRRVLERIHKVADNGAEIAVVSPPFLMMNASPERLSSFYRNIIQISPIPVGIYDRGSVVSYSMNDETLEELLAEPNLVLVKDISKFHPDRAAMIRRIRARKPGFKIFCGDEFGCIAPIQHAYNGLLLGRAVFNATIARAIMALAKSGDLEGAQALQIRMNQLMYRIYGGEKISCWLSGLKYLMVKMGIFATTQGHLEYPLTNDCREAIDEIIVGPDESGYRADLFGMGNPRNSADNESNAAG